MNMTGLEPFWRMDAMSIRILLVDDEAVDLEWLRRRVASSPFNLHIVGALNTGFLALKVLEQSRLI